jgi:hypothetical protein
VFCLRLKRVSNFKKENFVYIFGENHSNLIEIASLRDKIRGIKPDFVLLELFYDDEVWSKEEALDRLKNCKNGNKCDPRLNIDWYELAYELDIPFIGIDLQTNDIHIKNNFKNREQHMVNMIKDYMIAGTIVVVVGDTHLRTIETNELGESSLIQKEFANNPKVFINRSKEREIN